MENQNLADVSSQQTSIDRDNAPPTLPVPNETQQADDKVNAFMKFAYEELTNERDFFKNENMALRFKYLEMEKTLEEQNVELDLKKAIENENARLREVNAEFEATNKKYIDKVSTLEKQQETDRQARDKEKKAFEAEITRLNQAKYELETSNKKNVERISYIEKIHGDNHRTEKKTSKTPVAEMKQSHDRFEHLVVKKIVSNQSQKVWKCYSTLDGNKESANLSLIDNTLLFDGVISEKLLILDGILSQYKADPFIGKHQSYSCHLFDVSRLLSKVYSCNITDLFLYNQMISWREFEKLVSSGNTKNLYFDAVDFTDYKADPVQKILENVPNIEKFAYFQNSNTRKVAFYKNLPFFTKLREFKISKISDLDVQSFIAFMKSCPNAHFYISFSTERMWDIPRYEKTKRLLESLAPVGKLHIQSL